LLGRNRIIRKGSSHGEVLDPFALFDHGRTQEAFDQIRTLADDIQGKNGKSGESAETESQGDYNTPDKAAVEQEGHHGLTAGAEGKIGGIGIRIEGHHHPAYQNQLGCQVTDIVAGVVDPGEETGDTGQQSSKDCATQYTGEKKLAVGVTDLGFRVSGTQHLAHKDAHGVAHGKEYHTGQIENSAGDIHGRYHIQPAGGVALVQRCHAAGPEKFVNQKGHALDHDGFQKGGGDVQAFVCTNNIGILFLMDVHPACNDDQLHIPGDDGGQRRAFHTHGGGSEMAEDQNIVAHKIDEHSYNAAHHGYHGLAGFPEGAGIDIGQGEGRKAPDHDPQILQSVFHSTCRGGGIAVTGEIQTDQRLTESQEEQSPGNSEKSADQHLEAEGVPDALVIPGAVELGGEDARAGTGTEDAEVEHKDQTVDNGNPAHGYGAHLADHNVVQKIYEIGNAVLDHNGHGDPEKPAVKGPVTNISMHDDNLGSINNNVRTL